MGGSSNESGSRIVLALFVLACFWIGNGRSPLWDRDEPRFAQAAREMRERGDWVVPTFGGEGRYHKPILPYWLLLAGTWAFGDGPFGARAASGVMAALAVLATGRFARELVGDTSPAERRRLERWTVCAMATAPVVFVVAHLAIADGALLFFVVAAQWSGWRLLVGRGGWGSVVSLWTALALGLLTKGPVAPMVYLATLAATRLFAPLPEGWLGRHRLALGVPLLVAIALPWAVVAQARTDGAFLREAIGVHVIERSLRPFEGHGIGGLGGWLVGLPAYAVLLPAITLPWSLPGLADLAEAWRERARSFDEAFLLGWIVGPLVVLSLVATKLPHYVLPLAPALALSAGRWVARDRGHRAGAGGDGEASSRVEAGPRLRAAAAVLYAFLATGLAWSGAVALRSETAYELLGDAGCRRAAGALVLGVTCLLVIAAGSLRVRWRASWSTLLLGGTLVFELALVAVALPAAGRAVVWEGVAADVAARGGAAATVRSVGELEPGLVYALGCRPAVLDEESALAAIRDRHASPPFVLIADLRSVGPELAGALRAHPEAEVRPGFAFAKGRRVEMVTVTVR